MTAALVARSRAYGTALAGLAGIALTAGVAAACLASRPSLPGPGARVPVVALAPMLVATVFAPCLDSPDAELDHSLPWPWIRGRAVALTGLTALAAVLLGLALLDEPRNYGALAMIRNTIGYCGLLALVSAWYGARAAWLPGFLWCAVSYLAAPHPVVGSARIWAWNLESGQYARSWVIPGLLCLAGLIAYAVRGPAAVR